MSYCRWSADDFQCDLYVYADVSGGYTIMTASNRRVFKEALPEPVELTEENAEQWAERYRLVIEAVESADVEPIDLPHAGDVFNLPQQEAVEFLQELADLGYKFPLEIIEEIRNEEPE